MHVAQEKAALVFNEQPYQANVVGNKLLEFRDLGYTILPDVFDEASVDAFRAQVESSVETDASGNRALPQDSPLMIQPVLAPRIRQMAGEALAADPTGPHKPMPALMGVGWRIAAGGQAPSQPDDGWHKDREHLRYKSVEYHRPPTVHVVAYLEDMDEAHGPTQVIPGSHLDPSLSPYRDHAPRHAFAPRKQDVVLWDQRLWHRGMNRTADGLRTAAIFDLYPVFAPNGPRIMNPAQRQALQESTDPVQQVLLGGMHAGEIVANAGRPASS